MELEIKDIIYNYRKENRITQEQLGEMLGVTKATISQWETGKRVPSVSLILEISDKTGIDPVLLYSAIANQRVSDPDLNAATNLLKRESAQRIGVYSSILPHAYQKESYKSVTAKITKLAESLESIKNDLKVREDDQEILDAYHNAPENIKSSIRMLLGINNED